MILISPYIYKGELSHSMNERGLSNTIHKASSFPWEEKIVVVLNQLMIYVGYDGCGTLSM